MYFISHVCKSGAAILFGMVIGSIARFTIEDLSLLSFVSLLWKSLTISHFVVQKSLQRCFSSFYCLLLYLVR